MKLSIITINYNNRNGLEKTIKSVINQSFHDFEYIIIDGGSNDGSVDVIKKYASKIDYWISESDNGIYNAMNKGIDVAKGQYCIFINSGDCLYSSETLLNSTIELDGTDIVTGTLMLDNDEQWPAPEKVTIPYLYEGSLSHPASFIKTSLLKKMHYDEKLKIVSDWKFFVQCLLNDNATYKSIPVIISIFDTSGISMTNMELCRKERMSVLENELSERILLYILYNTKEFDAKLYNLIRESKYRKFFYSLNIILIKFFCFVSRKKWASKFPFILK